MDCCCDMAARLVSSLGRRCGWWRSKGLRMPPCQDDVVVVVSDGRRCVAGRGRWQHHLQQKQCENKDGWEMAVAMAEGIGRMREVEEAATVVAWVEQQDRVAVEVAVDAERSVWGVVAGREGRG
ncbi:hypothetical protein GW17_00053847 [Ensete ventricosum]|nr:hypothetical protein GW17_00053847 [Ensete ventricosum]